MYKRQLLGRFICGFLCPFGWFQELLHKIPTKMCIRDRWSLERTENEPYQEPPDPVLDTVSQLVSSESREWTGSPTELAEAVNTGMAANALTKYLNVKSGRLLDEYHVRYENRAKHSGRCV